ncbi:hypothetical protein GJ668_01450 [Allochromatium palmeri]|uniref:SWIM-type domain-containing protein n=1 Tax=Allochromatium palmeri TaxID=231048 RepID=A0A6N8EBN6_9GAMM|nr:hypothetical protein [Allochromatium palmeri]
MLDTVITVDSLMDLAGSKVFWRGESYFSGNAVGRVHVMGDRIKARVQGTEVYQVELWEADGRLGYDCTCPHAADGYFCKHCVALGPGSPISCRPRPPRPVNGGPDLRSPTIRRGSRSRSGKRIPRRDWKPSGVVPVTNDC